MARAGLLLLGLLPVSAVPGGCPAGFGRPVRGSPCMICPEGTYSPEGEMLCQRCTAGTWSDIRGASKVEECHKCSEGTWSSQEGAISPEADLSTERSVTKSVS
ncbi:Scube2 [Symbiodinium natans]|uniref:Scube2 protein n=1 Tax=Symbiodinium natans TaxID=878477 RepID=A0A812M0N8_9DINO|nr:Scube2 [Symbiodinium natans]